ncbi:MAG: hypothetical protein AB7S38_42910 [Vulcanimicrobiota bacterium]
MDESTKPASGLAVAILSTALAAGATQISIEPGERMVRVFELVEGDRILSLEARPELGPRLLAAYRELAQVTPIDELEIGELNLEHEGKEHPISLVFDQSNVYLHLGRAQPWLRFTAVMRLAQEPSIQNCVETVLASALENGLSEAKVEPGDQHVSVLRWDGGRRWTGFMEHHFPMELYRPMIFHLKKLSGMEVADGSRSQYGRFQVQAEDGTVQVLISSNPTRDGRERLLMRMTPL